MLCKRLGKSTNSTHNVAAACGMHRADAAHEAPRNGLRKTCQRTAGAALSRRRACVCT